ncbi:putative armadillo-like helical protein [Helianthus annuus]|nr:putative armadillo-like helical protein [Helianthus annuus]
MANSTSDFHQKLILLAEPIRQSLSSTTPSDGSPSLKSHLQSLLPPPNEPDLQPLFTNFSLLCAALAASQTSTYDQLSWIPVSLSTSAESAFQDLQKAYSDYQNKDLLVELMPIVLPLLKSSITESSIDDDGDEASARVPVAYAVVAAYQFKWFVTQIDLQLLGKLCSLIIPCALTALDHWSPQVKGEGMSVFIHLAKHVSCSEFSLYEDVILDACCQNIASSDEIWEHVVEMSVLLVTCTQQNNPRSPWFEKVLNEMLSHLWRQPRSKERRIAWLKHIEPLFSGMGIVLLGHFRRLLPLFFKWLHADDDASVLLVLDSIKTVIKFTWIRYSPYYDKLIDELVTLYKDASMKVERENIRARILQILILLQQCKGQQFEAAWIKHKHDPNLSSLSPPLTHCSS